MSRCGVRKIQYYTYILFLRFYVYIFVGLVKCGVLLVRYSAVEITGIIFKWTSQTFKFNECVQSCMGKLGTEHDRRQKNDHQFYSVLSYHQSSWAFSVRAETFTLKIEKLILLCHES